LLRKIAEIIEFYEKTFDTAVVHQNYFFILLFLTDKLSFFLAIIGYTDIVGRQQAL